MTIRVDPVAKTISLSVRELCQEIVRGGSLNLLPLADIRGGIGREVHEEYQRQAMVRRPDYRREQSFSFQTQVRNYTVHIQGRIDGLYLQEGIWVVEEIKSVLDYDPVADHGKVPRAHLIQLRLYLYFLNQMPNKEKVRGQLILVGLDGSSKLALEVDAEPDETKCQVETAINRLIDLNETRQSRQGQKRAWADGFLFPFPGMRKGQSEMITAIEATLTHQRQLLISAPTGIGKTVAALYSGLKFALQNGLSVFFLTSKTPQQWIVAETLRLYTQATGDGDSQPSSSPPFLSLILQSKEKSCPNDELFCHEARCRFARDFYEKLKDSGILEALSCFPIVTPDLVYQFGVRHELCPFELALELLPQADLILCDYNYVYDPQVSLRGILDSGFSRTIVIVDEAHNLYSRARDYYSTSLDRLQIRRLLGSLRERLGPQIVLESALGVDPPVSPVRLERLPDSFCQWLYSFLLKLDTYFEQVIQDLPESPGPHEAVVSLRQSFFERLWIELEDLMRSYLVLEPRSTMQPKGENELLDFFYAIVRFCRILALEGDEFVQLLDRTEQQEHLRILCLDPSPQLKKQNTGFYTVIGMSATLSPLSFYRDVLGLDRDAQLLSLPSPFPSENRKILVIPTVSTTYRERAGNSCKIAQIMGEVIQIRPGNYFAFFPSFDYLEEVSWSLVVPGYQILKQERWMPDHARESLLDRLAEPGGRHLVMAVQGGIFAEGVDYPGEMAIGAFIVGPALPKVSFELELMRDYFETHYSQGFEYAYLYPGMNRVIQSAGRIIRRETDRGIILLMDKRFASETYARHLPKHWYESSPAELVSKDYLEEISRFWEGTND
jgi:DNA excision repair protein ERCC-2